MYAPYSPTPYFLWLVLQWLPKETEDDVSIRICLSKAAVVLQCWARTIVARRVVEETSVDAKLKTEFAFVMTQRVQMCFRRHRAREELRTRKMHYRHACIVQKFSRRKVCRDGLVLIEVLSRSRKTREGA